MGFESNVYFCNALMDTYVKCGSLASALRVFDEMPNRDVVSWTSVISGHVWKRDVRESIFLFNQMRKVGVEPSSVTVAVILRACGIEEDDAEGRQLFCFAIKKGCGSNELVLNSALTAFSKAGCHEEAEKLFTCIPNKSIISWNILMSGYALRGEPEKVIKCFETLRNDVDPSHETLTIVISASTRLGDIICGQNMHALALKSGQIDMVLEASLIDFYSKCGDLSLSLSLFEEVRAKNRLVWGVMMWGFLQNGHFAEAISLFRRMQDFGYEPTADSLRCMVEVGALRFGRSVHGYLIRNDFCNGDNLEALETSILNMYAKCGNIASARRCFDRIVCRDVTAWSSMIEGYAIHGLGSEALEIFHRMQKEGVKPNGITFLSLLSACSHSGLVTEGCKVFDSMCREYGVQPNLNHHTCIVDLLGRSGKLHEALKVIENMNSKADARIWGALLASCRMHSDDILGSRAAQELFSIEPDNVGYHVVLSNIQVGEGKWDTAEKIRKDMNSRNCTKKPGWSCIEEKGLFSVFVAADKSHPQAEKIYRILMSLTLQAEEMGTGANFAPLESSIRSDPWIY